MKDQRLLFEKKVQSLERLLQVRVQPRAAQGVACRAQGVACRAQGVACRAQGVACRAQGVACRAQGLACDSSPGELWIS
jgi:hypothetical protein